MAIFISEEFELDLSLQELGVFDSLMDEDSNFFINIKRLRNTEVTEFKDSYNKINAYFKELGILLMESRIKGDKLYKTAVKKFNFSEIKGINLGFSKGIRGAGFGIKLSNQIINDAFDIIKSGSNQPEIFHLVSLFEENVGPDRLSDMIATLIYNDIVKYTKRVNKELGINEDNYPDYSFDSGLIINPYKGCELLLLPIDILHELPIARCWDDIDRVVSENETIKNEINELLGKEWNKLRSTAKKNYIKDFIFMKPDLISRVIEDYKSTNIEEYDIYSNSEYLTQKLVSLSIKTNRKLDLSKKNSYESSLEMIDECKNWIENKKGSSILNHVTSRNEEKIFQNMLHGTSSYYCKINDLDISPESNSGRGPVDFKISRGADKTVIEIKLTSNKNCLHGFEVQIEEYAKSEETDNKIFILVDNGRFSNNIKKVEESYEKRLKAGENPATVIVIDAKYKDSASIYKPEETCD